MANDINIVIGANTKEAEKAITDFAKSAEKSVNKVSAGFDFLKTAAIATVGFFAGREVVNFFKESVAAAAEAEANLNQLNTALALAGNYSQEASKQMQDFASAIQKTTTIEDDAVLKTAALIENITQLDKDGLQNATKAAIDLSAALGMDLESAGALVAKSIEGNTGALKKYGIQVEKGDTETERLANTLKALSKFSGAAEGKVNTFAGSIEQLRNVYGDFKENVGGIITGNSSVVESIKSVSNIFILLADVVKENQKEISAFISKGINALVSAIPLVIEGTKYLVEGLGIVSNVLLKTGSIVYKLIAAFMEIQVIQDIFNKIGQYLTQWFADLVRGIGKLLDIISLIPGASTAFESLGIELESVSGGFKEMAKSLDDTAKNVTVGEDLAAGYRLVGETLDSAATATKSFTEGFSEGATKAAKVASGFAEDIKKAGTNSTESSKQIVNGNKAVQDSVEEVTKAEKERLFPLKEVLTAYQNIQKELENEGKSKLELIELEKTRAQDIATNTALELQKYGELDAAAGKLIQDYYDAAEAKAALARVKIPLEEVTFKDIGNFGSIISDKISNAFNTAKEGLGSISLGDIGEGFMSVFSKGAEIFKQIFSGDFIRNLGDTLTSMVDGITGLVDELPTIFENLMDQIFPLLMKIIDEVLPKLSQMFADMAPKLLDGLLKGLLALIKKLPDILRPLINAIPGLIKQIMQALPELITSLLSSLGTIIGDIIKIIPDVLVTILDNLDEIVLALVVGISEAADTIVISFIDAFLINGGLERVIVALIQAIPRICYALVEGILLGIRNSIGSFAGVFGQALSTAWDNISGAAGAKIADGFKAVFKWPSFPSFNWPSLPEFSWPRLPSFSWPSLPNSFIALENTLKSFTKLPPWLSSFQDIVDKLTSWVPSIGGGGGGGGWFSDTFGMASGGFVPSGFPNDSFPAKLTSGELVMPASTTDELFGLISDLASGRGMSEQSQNLTVNLKIGEKELANVLLNLNRQGFRTA